MQRNDKDIFTLLPKDMKNAVLSFVDKKDFKAVGVVNKQLNQFTNDKENKAFFYKHKELDYKSKYFQFFPERRNQAMPANINWQEEFHKIPKPTRDLFELIQKYHPEEWHIVKNYLDTETHQINLPFVINGKLFSGWVKEKSELVSFIQLLLQKQADINNKGKSPWMTELLIKKGAKVNAKERAQQQSRLSLFCRIFGSREQTSSDVNVNSKDNQHKSHS